MTIERKVLQRQGQKIVPVHDTTAQRDQCPAWSLLEFVTDWSNICKVDGGVNPDHQQPIHLCSFWVLLHIPALMQRHTTSVSITYKASKCSVVATVNAGDSPSRQQAINSAACHQTLAVSTAARDCTVLVNLFRRLMELERGREAGCTCTLWYQAGDQALPYEETQSCTARSARTDQWRWPSPSPPQQTSPPARQR